MEQLEWNELKHEVAGLVGHQEDEEQHHSEGERPMPKIRIDFSEMPKTVPAGSSIQLEPLRDAAELNFGDLVFMPRKGIPVLGRFLESQKQGDTTVLFLAKEASTKSHPHPVKEKIIWRVLCGEFEGRALNINQRGLRGLWNRLTRFGTA